MYRLHLPPALLLSDHDGDNLLEEDGVDSCSEIDESEKIEESDKDTKFAEGKTDMDPLGAGVVVIHGTLTRSKSNGSNTTNNSEDATNVSDDVTEGSDDLRVVPMIFRTLPKIHRGFRMVAFLRMKMWISTSLTKVKWCIRNRWVMVMKG